MLLPYANIYEGGNYNRVDVNNGVSNRRSSGGVIQRDYFRAVIRHLGTSKQDVVVGGPLFTAFPILTLFSFEMVDNFVNYRRSFVHMNRI